MSELKKNKSTLWNSKMISVITLVLFLAELFIILISNIYMNNCIEYEATAQQNRYEMKILGETLADASDYLTDEVRKYSITGDIEHLYNYWYEVNDAKKRDTVIDTLTGYNPPEDEMEFLEEAKRYSDILIETETFSMKMTMISFNQTIDEYKSNKKLYEYMKYVQSAELPEDFKNLTSEEMQKKAVDILYDKNYEATKNLIMNPIEKFQIEVNTRLNNEVENSIAGRKKASLIQIVCLVTEIMFMATLLIILSKLYITPLKKYSDDLEAVNGNDNDGLNLAKMRVMPDGAYELREFGRIFNNLSYILHKELERSVKAEKEMRIARDEADKANNAKSSFLAKMSHELRTPLNAITGYLYLLKNSNLDDKQSRYCESMRLSSENLLGLISDILDFSKIESGNMSFESVNFNIISLIKELYSVMESIASQKNLKFSLDITGDIPQYIKGDQMKLRQILMNLTGNALKFTEHGEVILGVKLDNSNNEGCTLFFSVKDTGIGISDDDRKKIFEPFVQSDAGITRKYGGTGLGLSICKMIIDEISGGKESLELKSELGKGSEFSFKMHFEKGTEENEIISENNDNFQFDTEKKILLIDDNEINLEVESEIIESYGLKVTVARSGKEAVELAENCVYDMVMMDIRMPDMDGYEVTAELRKIQKYRFIPIIALSADVVSGVAEKALESGMNCYVTKPLKPEKLCGIMKKYLKIAIEAPETLYSSSGKFFAVNECLKNINGNEKLMVKLAVKFIDNHKNSAEYVKSHIKSGNYGNASNILHDITGVSGNICCNELYKISRQLNDEVKCKKSDSLEIFMEVWNETISEIKEYINLKRHLLENNTAENVSFDLIYNDFIRLCSNYDIEAAELFEKYIVQFRNNISSEIFNKLDEAVKKYDFEKIPEILNHENLEG